MKYLTDSNGNRASIKYFGSEKAAQAALDSLKNCTNCTDCTDCTNCTDCTYCTNCTNCTYCTRCTSPLIVGPCRSDGYQFVVGDTGSIHAGCRVFENMTDARKHWTDTRGGTPLGDETMMILDYLENMSQMLGSDDG